MQRAAFLLSPLPDLKPRSAGHPSLENAATNCTSQAMQLLVTLEELAQRSAISRCSNSAALHHQ
jgi:hypothetical protein